MYDKIRVFWKGCIGIGLVFGGWAFSGSNFQFAIPVKVSQIVLLGVVNLESAVIFALKLFATIIISFCGGLFTVAGHDFAKHLKQLWNERCKKKQPKTGRGRRATGNG